MQLKLNRVGGNIEAHIDLSLSERRVAQQVAPRHVFADKSLADLELGIVIAAVQEEALRSACVNLKQLIDGHPSMRSTETVQFDTPQQRRHVCPCEEDFLGSRVIDLLKAVAVGNTIVILALSYVVWRIV